MFREVPKEFVTEVHCDFCPAMVSDGSPDGLGGTKFWGWWASLVVQAPTKVCLESGSHQRLAFPQIMKIEVTSGVRTKASYAMCDDCAEKLAQHLKDWARKAGRDGGSV